MKACPRCRRRFEPDSSFCPHDGDRLHPIGSARLGSVLGGQLRLDGILGQGATGVVYRGFQLGVERPVAIKLLHPELAHDPDLVARFLREGRAAARLSSPHIAAVYLVGDTDDALPYLAMELVPGRSLEELAADGPMDAARAVELARQIAIALADAHEAGIVHRDLKPSNVVVARRRDGERAVVLDFGIAKLDGPGGSQTCEGAVFGTPSYLAPEQAEGNAVPASDLYSLGVILYRLLAGRLPFDGGGFEVMVSHMVRSPPPLAEVAPSIDRELADLVMCCLAKAPSARPAGAVAVADALWSIRCRLLAPTRSRPRRATGRRRLLGAALGALVVVAGAAGSRHVDGGAPALAERAPPRPARATDAPPVLVAGERAALRARLPARLAVGAPAAIDLELWDGDGAPAATGAPRLTLIAPDGSSGALVAVPLAPGRYRASPRFALAGDHTLSIRPAATVAATGGAAADDDAIELVLAVAPR